MTIASAAKMANRRPRPQINSAYEAMLPLLRELRKEAGLTQRALAPSLKLDHTQIAKSEVGIRRIDPVEFARWAKACGVDPVEAYTRLWKLIERRV